MRVVLFAILSLVFVAIATTAGEIAFEPAGMDVVRDSTGFVQAMIKFKSVDGDTVRVIGVSGSCRCAMGSVQRPLAHDSTMGAIYMGVNAQHFTDSVNYVDYTITHTGSDKPARFRITVRVNDSDNQ